MVAMGQDQEAATRRQVAQGREELWVIHKQPLHGLPGAMSEYQNIGQLVHFGIDGEGALCIWYVREEATSRPLAVVATGQPYPHHWSHVQSCIERSPQGVFVWHLLEPAGYTSEAFRRHVARDVDA